MMSWPLIFAAVARPHRQPMAITAMPVARLISLRWRMKSYPTHTYHNTGLTNDWQSHESDGSRTLTGGWDMAGKKAKARCTTVFSHDGSSMAGESEMSIEGGRWQIFWDTKGTKAK